MEVVTRQKHTKYVLRSIYTTEMNDVEEELRRFKPPDPVRQGGRQAKMTHEGGSEGSNDQGHEEVSVLSSSPSRAATGEQVLMRVDRTDDHGGRVEEVEERVFVRPFHDIARMFGIQEEVVERIVEAWEQHGILLPL